ncbi:MAG TPA: thiamine phosphate synthase [Acidimicrobiales bacterium]|nr:thiamine phosphate synthase [Acidimicrobiales bacterium]
MLSLASRRLYLCVGLREDLTDFVRAVVEGGVDVVQLREKVAPASEQRRPAAELARLCRDLGVPFVVNDSPELAAEVGADGVHVGQDDVSVARCRALLGEAAIVGLSTHAEAELESALATSASYLSAGPIVATPTKAGRPGTGVGYALAAQRRSDRPVFVTGGVGAATVGALVGEGLRHFVVVRALTEAADPGAAARALRRALDDALSAVPVEPAQERRHHPGVGP